MRVNYKIESYKVEKKPTKKFPNRYLITALGEIAKQIVIEKNGKVIGKIQSEENVVIFSYYFTFNKNSRESLQNRRRKELHQWLNGKLKNKLQWLPYKNISKAIWEFQYLENNSGSNEEFDWGAYNNAHRNYAISGDKNNPNCEKPKLPNDWKKKKKVSFNPECKKPLKTSKYTNQQPSLFD